MRRPIPCECGGLKWWGSMRCLACRSREWATPEPCACGAKKQPGARKCWTCYLASKQVYMGLHTRVDAAAALEAYWPEWQAARERRAA